MSLHLEFEPHSWYMGFAIKDERDTTAGEPWAAYTADGNTYTIASLFGATLKDLHRQIREYHLTAHNGYGERIARRRLNYLRWELVLERISYGELAELKALAAYIQGGDVQLLEAAGVPEGEA